MDASQGAEEGDELTRVLLKGETRLDLEKAENDVIQAGLRVAKRHAGIGAIITECHNVAPSAAALSKARKCHYDPYSFVLWFQAGLQPRVFDEG